MERRPLYVTDVLMEVVEIRNEYPDVNHRYRLHFEGAAELATNLLRRAGLDKRTAMRLVEAAERGEVDG